MEIAFEYQGPQHDHRVAFFQKTEAEFQTQVTNDKLKVEACKKRGVTLYVIPYMHKNQLPRYISTMLNKTCGVFKFNPGLQLGLNLSESMTGAPLSKKTFFNTYYKPQKYPLYSLDDPMDKYIRDFYYGGRVEVFQLRKVDDDKFYYYDFTSLYPDRGREALPYGKPEWVDANTINPSELFGFVDVTVRSIDLTKKPLHAIKEDGKLLFRHFKEWTSLTLFSEELKMGIYESGIYEYKIESGLRFDSGPWMEKFFTDAVNKKAVAKSIGNTAMSQIYKIVANSGYGFWGLRVKDRDCIKIQ